MNTADFLVALGRDSAAAGVLVLLVLVVQRVFRRHLAPAWLCALWLLVLARLLPFSVSSELSLFTLFSDWSAPAATAIETAGTSATANVTTTPPPSALDAVTPVAFPGTSRAAGAPDATNGPRWAAWLFLIWGAGALALGSYVLRAAISLQRSLRRARPIDDPAVHALLRACCAEMRVPRAPALLESAAVLSPALHGVFRPRLLLPVGFTRAFSREELRFVFLHELAHVRRRDLAVNWLMTGLQIAHWFNPLVWLAFARWRADREVACDAAALEAAGAANNRAYGGTMLRLLETFCPSSPSRQPSLVGILESRRQLRRRIAMIGGFRPAGRPVAGIGLLAILGLVGLTDAPVASVVAPLVSAQPAPVNPPAPAHAPAAKFAIPAEPVVLFLINRGETMLGASEAEIAAWRSRSNTEKGTAPKWQLAVRTLEASLRTLPVNTSYRVVLCGSGTAGTELIAAGVRTITADERGREALVRRLTQTAPIGAFSLETAFERLASPDPADGKAVRVVLITDGISTVAASDSQAVFTRAVQLLPPQTPVHTLLLPLASEDRAVAGHYWELAHATGGALTTVAFTSVEPRTHLAFVVDTSGSMREPKTGGLWPAVIESIEATLDAHPHLVGLQLVDGDGRFLLGRRGQGAKAWIPATAEARRQVRTMLERHQQDSISNPIPGLYNALRHLTDATAPDLRMGVYLLGDEFVTKDDRDAVLRRLDELNPRDANGRRAVVINAIGYPTTIRFSLSMGNTGVRFAELMRTLTHEHGGSFVGLPEL